jgi:hypothetical protein
VLVEGGRLGILGSGLRRREGVKLDVLILATVGPEGSVREIVTCLYRLTGVLSSSTSEVAEVAASIRSSHRFP